MNDTFLHKYAQEKHLHADLYAELINLDLHSKQHLENMINILSPSANSLAQLYRLIKEISKKDRCSISEVFNRSEVSSSLNQEKVSRKEKLAGLRKCLEELRFPEKFKLIKHAQDLTNEIRKKYGVRLQIPEELEGENVEVTFLIKSESELSSKLKTLESLQKSEELSKLFNLLLGRN